MTTSATQVLALISTSSLSASLLPTLLDTLEDRGGRLEDPDLEPWQVLFEAGPEVTTDPDAGSGYLEVLFSFLAELMGPFEGAGMLVTLVPSSGEADRAPDDTVDIGLLAEDAEAGVIKVTRLLLDRLDPVRLRFIPLAGRDLFRHVNSDLVPRIFELPMHSADSVHIAFAGGLSSEERSRAELPARWSGATLAVIPRKMDRAVGAGFRARDLLSDVLYRGDALRLEYRVPEGVWGYILRVRGTDLDLTFGARPVLQPGQPSRGWVEIVMDERECQELPVLLLTLTPAHALETVAAQAAGLPALDAHHRLFYLATFLSEAGQRPFLLISGPNYPHRGSPPGVFPPAICRARDQLLAEDFPGAAESLRALLQDTEGIVDRAKIQTLLGTAQRRLSLPEAERTLRLAIATAETADAPDILADARRELGRFLADRDRFEEADELLHQAIDGHRNANDSIGEAYDLQHLAFSNFRQGRLEVARSGYLKIIEPSRQSGEIRLMANALMGFGQTLNELGHFSEARRISLQSRAIMEKLQNRRSLGIVNGDLGLLALNQGRLDEAMDYFQQELECFRAAGLAFHTAIAHLNLGYARVRMKQYAEARQHFHLALPGLDDPNSGYALFAVLMLAEMAILDGKFEEARELLSSTRVKNRQMNLDLLRLVALAEGRLKELTRADDVEDAYLNAIRTQEVWRMTLPLSQRSHVNDLATALFDQWILSLVNSGGPTERLLAATERARARALRDLLEAAESQEDTPAQPIAPESLDVASLRAALSPGSSVIVTHALQDRLILILISRETLAWTSVPVEMQGLRSLCESVIADCRAPVWREGATRLPSHEALGALLFGQIRSWILSTDTELPLGILPHGPLHGVPLHTLPVPGPQGEPGERLCQHRAVYYAPSLHAIQHWVEAPPPVSSGMLILADPLQDLRHAREEARWLHSVFPGSRILAGEEATAAALQELAPEAHIIHLAIHASRGKGEELPYLILAPDPTRVEENLPWWETLARPERALPSTGKVDARWIRGLKLSASLVVASACESGAGDLTPGSDGFDLLSWAFLGAGARSVVSTSWMIPDKATSLFMKEFYRHIQAGMPRAVAVARAQRRFLRAGDVFPETAPDQEESVIPPQYSHPYFWAGSFLMGDWR